MLRLAQSALEPDDVDESVTVAEAARRLGCDEATVRALLRERELSGHRVGKCKKNKPPRGVRVHAKSIRAYMRRNAISAEPANDAVPPKKSRRTNAAQAEAEKYLRGIGAL